MPNARLKAGRPRADVDAEVLLKIENDSSISVRTIETNTGLPKSVAHRILKRHSFHPYHLQRVMIIPIESSFVKQFYKKNNEDPQFLDRILWTDETTCKRDGYLNLHNLHSWSVENPHLMREDRSQYSFKINLWTGILNRKIIGPCELPENLTGEVYLNFLHHNLPDLLEDVPLNILREMWYQGDGCPAHYARPV